MRQLIGDHQSIIFVVNIGWAYERRAKDRKR
jgi:hypothetical protein